MKLLKGFLCCFFIFLTVAFCFAQNKEITLSGKYHGLNLIVLNPSVHNNDALDFCVETVYVNGKKSKDAINSNAFEIDFSLLSIEKEEDVVIKIIHKADCKPKVLNELVLELMANFTMRSPRVDSRSNMLTWSISGTIDKNPFFVDQFRWEKWITLGKVMPEDTVSANTYNFAPENHFHSRHNLFRIRHIDNAGVERISRDGRFFSRDPEITLLSSRVDDWIYFSGDTHFEVYDEKGFFITGGFGKEADISGFEKGRYWVSFDNTTEIVTKR